jgi:hypothetical protein
MGDRNIYKQQPKRAEKKECGKPQTIGDRAGDQRHGNDGKRHLVDHEETFGNCLRERRYRIKRHAVEKNTFECPDESAFAGEGQAIPNRRPHYRNQKCSSETLRHGGEHIFLAHHASVEKRKPRNCHHQHEAGRADHPGGVSAVDLGCLREGRRCHDQQSCGESQTQIRPCHIMSPISWWLECVHVSFAGADAHRLFNRCDENLAITDLTGLSGAGERFHNLVELLARDRNFKT